MHSHTSGSVPLARTRLLLYTPHGMESPGVSHDARSGSIDTEATAILWDYCMRSAACCCGLGVELIEFITGMLALHESIVCRTCGLHAECY